MAILAMPEHGQDARGTKSSRAAKNRGISNTDRVVPLLNSLPSPLAASRDYFSMACIVTLGWTHGKP
jgi:hypothetical protein